MATEKVTKLNQDLAAIDKKIEVRRTRSSGEKPIVVLDPSYPTEGLRIYSSTDSEIFNFDVQNGYLHLKGTNSSGNNIETGSITTGINGGGASLQLNAEDGTNTIRLSGQDGTIYGANADLAENFACTQGYDAEPGEGLGIIKDPIEPGDVLVISDDGTLVKCEGEYDTRVAGVVSGAKEYKPAIILDEFDVPGTEDNYYGKGIFPVALAGKVYCKVTGKIKAGDLLVTSTMKGVAMRADPENHEKWSGTIIGKALGSSTRTSIGSYSLIPILVMLG